MGAAWLIVISIGFFVWAYLWYGSYLAKKFDFESQRSTPAHSKNDGIDYVPAKKAVLMGHHFSSIAGAGPIIGPIYAAIFGWAPVFLWILLGSVFFGGVHDFASLAASIRHGGKTIGEVIEEHIGKAGKKLFLIFAWFVLILVMAVFEKAIASVFVKEPATASSSLLLVVVAIGFGICVNRLNFSLLASSVIGFALVLGCVMLGTYFPIELSFTTWIYVLLGYIFVASVTPVWLLLQPRDYLNSFLLYMILVAGVVGIFIINPQISFPAVTEFHTNIGYLFPILFVTVACGAISGFHSLVSAGTTAKQLNQEKDGKPVVYGSMLIEGVLAVVSLITAVTLLQSDYFSSVTSQGGGPIGIFSAGVGGFIAQLGIPPQIGVTFAALAISAFALTTLDTSTRLGRFIFQEYFEVKEHKKLLANNRYLGTSITVLSSALLAMSGTSDTLWPLFGSANQLLASIALLAITVWLAELRKSNAFVKYPMIFMFAVSIAALVNLMYVNLVDLNIPILLFSTLLFGIAIALVYHARTSLKRISSENNKIPDDVNVGVGVE